jgi:hypothetical protein
MPSFTQPLSSTKNQQLKILKPISLALIIALFSCANKDIHTAELNPENQKLFNLIKEKDSLLFQIGFNQVDTLQVSVMTSNDFEFYHDEHGVTETKNRFVNNINGIKELPFKTWRTLVEGSMEVFPLYKDNSQVLYGAIQNGVHDFYQQNEGEDALKTNTARFTHLWIIENGDWKLKRVLSYDHQIPK